MAFGAYRYRLQQPGLGEAPCYMESFHNAIVWQMRSSRFLLDLTNRNLDHKKALACTKCSAQSYRVIEAKLNTKAVCTLEVHDIAPTISLEEHTETSPLNTRSSLGYFLFLESE